MNMYENVIKKQVDRVLRQGHHNTSLRLHKFLKAHESYVAARNRQRETQVRGESTPSQEAGQGKMAGNEHRAQDPVTSQNSDDMYPSAEKYDDDRIVSQLSYVPEGVRRAREEGREVPVKKIQLMHSLHSWGVKVGVKFSLFC